MNGKDMLVADLVKILEICDDDAQRMEKLVMYINRRDHAILNHGIKLGKAQHDKAENKESTE